MSADPRKVNELGVNQRHNTGETQIILQRRRFAWESRTRSRGQQCTYNNKPNELGQQPTAKRFLNKGGLMRTVHFQGCSAQCAAFGRPKLKIRMSFCEPSSCVALCFKKTSPQFKNRIKSGVKNSREENVFCCRKASQVSFILLFTSSK